MSAAKLGQLNWNAQTFGCSDGDTLGGGFPNLLERVVPPERSRVRDQRVAAAEMIHDAGSIRP